MSDFITEALMQRYDDGRGSRLPNAAAAWVFRNPECLIDNLKIQKAWDVLLQEDSREKTYQTVMWIKARLPEIAGRLKGNAAWKRERRAEIAHYRPRIEQTRVHIASLRRGAHLDRTRQEQEAAEARRREKAERAEQEREEARQRRIVKEARPVRIMRVIEDEDMVLAFRAWSRNYGQLRRLIEQHRAEVEEAGEPGEFDVKFWQDADALNDRIVATSQKNKELLDQQRQRENESLPMVDGRPVARLDSLPLRSKYALNPADDVGFVYTEATEEPGWRLVYVLEIFELVRTT